MSGPKKSMVSEKNKANRGKKKMVQVTSKKGYARVREELMASSGQDPSRLEMFRACFSKYGTTKNVEAADAIVEDEVFLKSILNSAETVARGWVRSLDPKDIVGYTKFGPEWCEVNVQVPIKKGEKLVRPYGLFSTIQDSIGASITWTCPFISVVRED